MLEDVKYINKKKSIHVNIDKSQHRIFRSNLFLHGLTMQQFIEMSINKFNIEDPEIMKMVESLKDENKVKEISKLKGIQGKDLYDAIEKYSPIS